MNNVILKAVEISECSKGSRIGLSAVLAAIREAPCSRTFDGLTLATGHVLKPPGDSILTNEMITARRAKSKKSSAQ